MSQPRLKSVRTLSAIVCTGVLGLAACGNGGSNGAATEPASPGTSGTAGATAAAAGQVSGTVTVFAAASLQESFEQIGADFESANPGVDVQLGFGPSSGLAQQIISGAPADVFASASTANMDQVVDANAAESPTTFAQNVLEIAVPADNPGNVQGLNDLTREGVTVAVCQPQVPCGVVAQSVLENANINLTPVSRENDVRAVLTKVQLGEVDAGLVYATDVQAAGDEVQGIEVPADVNESTTYPIAVLTDAPNKAGGQAFMDHVLSPEGSAVITRAGFAAP